MSEPTDVPMTKALQRVRHHRLQVAAAISVAVLVAAGTVAALSPSGGEATDAEPTPTRHSAREAAPSRPDRAKSQSPATWVDTKIKPRINDDGWAMADPLRSARDAWYDVVAAHLDQAGELVKGRRLVWQLESTWRHRNWWVEVGILVDDGDGQVMEHVCPLSAWSPPPAESPDCRQDRLVGPHGEDAWLIVPRRSEGPDGCRASPICAKHVALVVVERADGTFGHVTAFGHGRKDADPFPLDLMAEAAADPRLTLPPTAFRVPLTGDVVEVVREHFGSFRRTDTKASPLGIAGTDGHLAIPATPFDKYTAHLSVTVTPAGRAPRCGKWGLRSCVARQIYGASDPTTVYLGEWCNEAACWRELV
ncbi:hypothetical protein [Nocardioides pelophilus]|uniref:hypothetical protein n=1 Tax=Nocardioides pelophilus TaxID=2172019 RepID=UPI0016038F15|nr:hypothetical protein [Nocardioides pelophilus]